MDIELQLAILVLAGVLLVIITVVILARLPLVDTIVTVFVARPAPRASAPGLLLLSLLLRRLLAPTRWAPTSRRRPVCTPPHRDPDASPKLLLPLLTPRRLTILLSLQYRRDLSPIPLSRC